MFSNKKTKFMVLCIERADRIYVCVCHTIFIYITYIYIGKYYLSTYTIQIYWIQMSTSTVFSFLPFLSLFCFLLLSLIYLLFRVTKLLLHTFCPNARAHSLWQTHKGMSLFSIYFGLETSWKWTQHQQRKEMKEISKCLDGKQNILNRVRHRTLVYFELNKMKDTLYQNLHKIAGETC